MTYDTSYNFPDLLAAFGGLCIILHCAGDTDEGITWTYHYPRTSLIVEKKNILEFEPLTLKVDKYRAI